MRKSKKAKQSRIGDKIALLRREGKDAKSAAGEAYGMEREGRLKSGGHYVRAAKKRRNRRSSRA